jgi:exo-beta-1,3-glucanase (GH17 family)
MRLRAEGWRGLVTYSLDGTLQAVPRLAKEVGFTMIIAGLFWFDDAQLARERTAALGQLFSIDGFVLGNEGLKESRYTRQRLTNEFTRLKAETGRPVTTSETFAQYQNDPTLLAFGDWVFPNLQFWFDLAIRTPSQAVDIVQNQYQTLQIAAPGRIVVVKEAWWPTAGEPAATEANQTEFFRQWATTQVKFVFGEAYDQFWKTEALGQGPHWGLHTDTGTPKQIIQALQSLYTGPY